MPAMILPGVSEDLTSFATEDAFMCFCDSIFCFREQDKTTGRKNAAVARMSVTKTSVTHSGDTARVQKKAPLR